MLTQNVNKGNVSRNRSRFESIGVDHQVCEHAYDRHPERRQQACASDRRDLYVTAFGRYLTSGVDGRWPAIGS
jgi:hypothetical protein